MNDQGELLPNVVLPWPYRRPALWRSSRLLRLDGK